MSEYIGFQTRLVQDGKLVTAGTFGGNLSIGTANRLVKGHNFTVVVKPSGTPVFVDRAGREVRLFFRIRPEDTEVGKCALMLWRDEQRKLAREKEEREEEERDELERLLEGLSHEEAVRRLTRED